MLTATLLAIWNSGCCACSDRLNNGPVLRTLPCAGHHFTALTIMHADLFLTILRASAAGMEKATSCDGMTNVTHSNASYLYGMPKLVS